MLAFGPEAHRQNCACMSLLHTAARKSLNGLKAYMGRIGLYGDYMEDIGVIEGMREFIMEKEEVFRDQG